MKRTIALILSFTLVITGLLASPIYAASIKVSEEARALETIGMLEGDGSGVTSEYMGKRMHRFTAAISILKLRGLYDEALKYTKTGNFKDIGVVEWKEGRNILAYLKANPDLGFIGNEKGEFLPYKDISEQEYFKVLLETLGYKQKVSGKSGDFSWGETLDYAKNKGLKPSYKSDFNIDLLAKATVSALNAKTKAGKVYIVILVDSGKVKKSKAVSAGFIKEELNATVKSAKAIGNTVVEVKFKENISKYDAEYTGNYSIDGLSIKEAIYTGDNTVRLTTSSQSNGRQYTLYAGGSKIRFTGISKISGAPNIKTVKSEDDESVVVEFDKELDYDSAMNSNNYTIAGVDVEKAVLTGKKVELSTYGLTSRKQYTLKVTNMKSVDGAVLKSQSKTFSNRPDTTPPSVKEVIAETNERVIVIFSEGVSKDTAEDLYNYTIESNNGELDIYEAILFGDDEDRVELVTEPQKASAKYEITIENIEDKTKVGNVMKKAIKKTFVGAKEDNTAPSLSKNDIKILSKNRIQVAFTDNSRMDEDTVLDAGNYELIKNDRWKDEIYVDNVEKISFESGKYKVALEVDDLESNMSYTLKVYNIADEFGNVLEKNNTATISISKEDLAPAKYKSHKMTKLDEIEIVFTKPLDKESAEDVYNYSINNYIGYPSKAVYKDEKVILTTAKMTEGKTYRLTIDGVEDQSGNVIRQNIDFKAVAEVKSEVGPVLVHLTSLNKYVAAAVFDKPVSYTSDGSDRTILILKTGYTEIKLYAKATSTDEKTIEFSDIEGRKILSDYAYYSIDEDKSLRGITDKTANKNKYDNSVLKNYYITVPGNSSEPEALEVKDITQTDNRTFKVTMSREVVIKRNTAESSPYAIFAAGATNDKKVVTFTITPGYINGGTDYKIDLSKVLEDRHGLKSENTGKDYTTFYSENKDYIKPFIRGVRALDANTVEIEYNEDMGYSGKYTIKNTDPYVIYNTILTSLKKIDGKKVILSLNIPLEKKYRYSLFIDEQGKDLAGNPSLDLVGDKFFIDDTDAGSLSLLDYKEAEALVVKLENAVVTLNNTEQINTAKSHLNNANKKTASVSDANLKKDLNNRITIAGSKIQTAEDKLAANGVITKIDLLPSYANLTLEHKGIVEAARKAYNDLTKAQKDLVTNYSKLTGAEERIAGLITEQEEKEQEKKKKEAEEQAKLATAKAAVEALENAGESASGKATAFLNKVEEMNLALNAYISYVPSDGLLYAATLRDTLEMEEGKAINAIAGAAALVNELDLFIDTLSGKIAAAEEACKSLGEGDAKVILSGRTQAVKSKIDGNIKAIGEAKEKIKNAKIEAAKKWLNAGMLPFNKTDKADSDAPLILPLENHKAGASFYYKEIGSIVDGRFVKAQDGMQRFHNTFNSLDKANLQFVDEIKGDKTVRSIKVNRGAELAAVAVKVEIISENKTTYKIFNITIPPKAIDTTGNTPVTITEVQERTITQQQKSFGFR